MSRRFQRRRTEVERTRKVLRLVVGDDLQGGLEGRSHGGTSKRPRFVWSRQHGIAGILESNRLLQVVQARPR